MVSGLFTLFQSSFSSPRPPRRPQLPDIQSDRWLSKEVVDDPRTSGAIVRYLFDEGASGALFAVCIDDDWKPRAELITFSLSILAA